MSRKSRGTGKGASPLLNYKKKKMQRVWAALIARGYRPPKDDEENRKRAKEAHGY